MLTKPNILRLVFFIAAFAGALYIPLREVLAFERPKNPPVEMRFRIGGYDPYDPSVGNYLRLHTLTELSISAEDARQPGLNGRRPKAFVLFETDRDGMARAAGLVPADRMPAGKTFVKAAFRLSGKDDGKERRCEILLPFDRYYINRKLDDNAQNLLRKATAAAKPAVLVVDVYADGRYAVKDLLIDGKPLHEYLAPKK